MHTFSASDGCACSGEATGHFYCDECFSDMVTAQVTGAGKPAFLADGCVIMCPVCKAANLRAVFDMRLYAPHLTPAAYSAHLKTMGEPEVAREQKEWRERLEQQLAEARLQGGGAAAVDECAAAVDFIANRLIQPECPDCGRLLPPDFDACAALQCGRFDGSVNSEGMGCGAHLCAWCLHVCNDKDACHKHVVGCLKNPNPGTTTTTTTTTATTTTTISAINN